MSKILYIHCGTHKTGTSAIQKFLKNNQEKLEKNNLHYTNIGNTKAYPDCNHNLAWKISGDPKLEKLNDSLNDFFELLKISNKNLIISSEDFQFINLEKQSYDKFCEEIYKNNYKIKVILYLRNQFDYFRGVYQILLMSGVRFINFKQSLTMIKQNDHLLIINKTTFCFNYNFYLKNIKEKLSVSDDDIICKSYDENKENLIQSFNNIINFNEISEIERYSSINVALPQLVVDLMETLNKNIHMSKIDFKSSAFARRNLVFNKFFRLGKRFQIEDDETINYFKNEFHKSNLEVENLYKIRINKFI